MSGGNYHSGLPSQEVQYDLDAEVTFKLPAKLKHFLLYDADVPYDAIQIRSLLDDGEPEWRILQVVKEAQRNDRRNLYPDLTPQRSRGIL